MQHHNYSLADLENMLPWEREIYVDMLIHILKKKTKRTKKDNKTKENNMDFNNDGKISFWEMFPYWFDKLRIFPRVFISVYIYMFYNVANWFMSLPEPNNAQAGLVSVVVGAGAAWFGLYVNSTGKGVETVSRNERVVKSTKKNQIG